MVNPVSQVGSKAVRFVQELGGMAVFSLDVARTIVSAPLRFAALVREIYKIGVLSILIICVCGMAVGMVLGLQGHHTLSRFGASALLGAWWA